MRPAILFLPLAFALAACGGTNGRPNASFTPSGDTIALNDPVSRQASKAATLAAAQKQCAAMGRQAHYVASQANLGAEANEHLYLCW